MKNQRLPLRAALWRRGSQKPSSRDRRAGLPPTGQQSKPPGANECSLYSTAAATHSSDENDPVIPVILVKCKQELLARGLHVEGIFRRSGSSVTIERLLKQFKEIDDPESIALDAIPIHTIAGLFKRFLQQLSEPVVPRSFQSQFLHVFESTTDDQERRRHLEVACRDLPPRHGNLLAFVLAVAHTISCHCDENKMSAENLAIIFAPTCIRLDAIGQLLPDQAPPCLSSSISVKSIMSFSSHLSNSKLLRNISFRLGSRRAPSNDTATASSTSMPHERHRLGDVCKSILFRRRDGTRRKGGCDSSSCEIPTKTNSGRPMPRYEPEKLMQLDLVKAHARWNQLFEFMIKDPPRVQDQARRHLSEEIDMRLLTQRYMDEAEPEEPGELQQEDSQQSSDTTSSTVYFDSLDEHDPTGRTMLDILDETMAALSDDTAAFFETMVSSEKLMSYRSKRETPPSDQSSTAATISPMPAAVTPADPRDSPRFAGTKYEAVWQHWREREEAQQIAPGPAPRVMKRSSGIPHHGGDWLKALSQHHFAANKQRPLSLTFIPRSPAQKRLSAFLR